MLEDHMQWFLLETSPEVSEILNILKHVRTCSFSGQRQLQSRHFRHKTQCPSKFLLKNSVLSPSLMTIMTIVFTDCLSSLSNSEPIFMKTCQSSDSFWKLCSWDLPNIHYNVISGFHVKPTKLSFYFLQLLSCVMARRVTSCWIALLPSDMMGWSTT